MNSEKMKPIVPIPKRVNGFSIDSIMRRDDGERPSNSSDESEQGDDVPSRQTASPEDVHRLSIASRIPPLHPALPAHVKQLLLHGSTSDASRRLNQDLNALQSQAWAYGSPALGTFPTLGVGGMGLPPQLAAAGLQQTGSALHPGLLAASRDPFSMYPWMLNRQSPGMFGLPYGHPDTGLFYHPYRKPKRIRTAFSPSQLLKLEHAFEKNHYVVGQERKELASKLSLTETQVKVWFQNRRTKHKRVRSDDEADPENGNISIDDDDIATTSYSDPASSYDDKEQGETESVRQCS